MKALAQSIFISEIVKQAKIAGRAAARLPAPNNDFDEIEVWCSIQSILVAAGNVSKILWPSQKYKMRGKMLRTLLSVDDSNPLSDRNFRNHFEHYDERIEDWFKKNLSAVYTDSIIDPLESMRMFKSAKHHRAYDPLTKMLKFRGESLNFADLLSALEEIRHKCRPYVLP